MPRQTKEDEMNEESPAEFFINQEINGILRRRMLSVCVPVFLSALGWLYRQTLWFPEESFKIIITNTAIALCLIASFFFLLLWYLQTGFRDRTILQRELSHEYKNRDTSSDHHLHIEKIKELSSEIDKLKRLHSDNLNPLSQELAKTILQQAEPALLAKIEAQIESHNKNLDIVEEIKESRLLATGRIEEELKRLVRGGSTTLAIGVSIAIIGIIALALLVFPKIAAFSIFTDSLDLNTASASAIAFHYAPRFSLVVSIEILAYFFLRLHKSKLIETKYYQNELTNLELKFVSLITAIQIERNDTSHQVITNLSETERNHILEKGQSTTELKRVELEKNQFIEVTKSLVSLAPKSK